MLTSSLLCLFRDIHVDIKTTTLFFSYLLIAVCGGEVMVTDEQGHLESPNFPDDYLPNKECVWKLTAPEGYQVGLKFNVFEVYFYVIILVKLIYYRLILTVRKELKNKRINTFRKPFGYNNILDD